MTINPLDILKNAQKIQEQMGAMQEKLGRIRVTGAAGGGMVEIDMNGKLEVLAVRIDPELFAGGDRELLQGLIGPAFADGQEKVKEAINRDIGNLGAIFGLGGMPPFQGFPGAGLA